MNYHCEKKRSQLKVLNIVYNIFFMKSHVLYEHLKSEALKIVCCTRIVVLL